MAQLVSKTRTRRAKERERLAARTAGGASHLRDSPAVRLFLGVLVWAATLAIIHSGEGVYRQVDVRSLFLFVGDGAFLLISMFTVALLLEVVAPETLRRNSSILILAVISLTSVGLARAVLHFSAATEFFGPEARGFLVPFALTPILATILLNSATGIAAGIWSTIAMATMCERSFAVLITGLVATVVAAGISRQLRTRLRVARTGLFVGLAEGACVLGMTAMRWEVTSTEAVLHQTLACLISGLSSALLVLIVLPVLESVFGVTSDVTLLELSDLAHPVLQRLAIEAPGTYHHSLVVAQLAQAAADEVDANALLARVSAYFHDVGKLTKPDFFSENIRIRANPHDDLPPSMSTLVITSHVKEGVSLAMLHRLPHAIMRAITEHHGTSLVSCFHHKAAVLSDPRDRGWDGTPGIRVSVVEGDFRYPGPKPTSKESAIVCLADAVEAASRSLEKATPGHIENLVNDIVNKRMEDGQLDNCDLSLAEISRIKRSFVFTLTNMLHGRVAYPSYENPDKQRSELLSREQTEGSRIDTATADARNQSRAE